jgi:hypothetical protein
MMVRIEIILRQQREIRIMMVRNECMMATAGYKHRDGEERIHMMATAGDIKHHDGKEQIVSDDGK